MARPWTSNRAAGKAPRLTNGFRSGLEKKISDDLQAKGVPFEYEKMKIGYTVPEREARYTPDFVLLHNGIILEGKGILDAEDRKKHLLVKAQHPELDIRFIFSRSSSPIYKGSPTTYAKWCEHHGFKYADKLVPEEWLREPPRNTPKP